MVRINRNDAEQEIIQEWRALPDNERRTGAHAVRFAMEIKDKYPFRPNGFDRYQAAYQFIIRYQILIGAPLE